MTKDMLQLTVVFTYIGKLLDIILGTFFKINSYLCCIIGLAEEFNSKQYFNPGPFSPCLLFDC